MTRRLTLRLPDELHRRLQARSRRSGRSLNAEIIGTLDVATDCSVEEGRRTLSREEELQIIRGALGDLVVDTSDWLLNLPPSVTPLDPDTLRDTMPVLDPPLSQTIIQEREESRY